MQVALADATQALQLVANDPLALRVRGDVYQALQRPDEAVSDYRTALAQDPFQAESRAALVKLGQEVPPQQTGQPIGEEVAGWIITEPSPGRYVASNTKFPQVQAELEMFGAGKPKILEWKLLKDALSGIGLLKYYAGDFNEGQDSSLEYVAIVDTRASKVVSIEPHSWGQATAQWNWQAVSVVVTDPDGNANEIQLRKERSRPAAGPPVARNDFWGFQQQAPVARGDRAARRAARRGGGGPGGGGGRWWQHVQLALPLAFGRHFDRIPACARMARVASNNHDPLPGERTRCGRGRACARRGRRPHRLEGPVARRARRAGASKRSPRV